MWITYMDKRRPLVTCPVRARCSMAVSMHAFSGKCNKNDEL